MDHPVVVVVLTIVVLVVIKLLVLLAWGGGSLARLGVAFQAFRRVLGDEKVADKVKPLLAPPEPEKPKKLSGEPLRLLSLLQREGRVLDFFLEDIAGASDEQIGAGVRELHRKAQAVIKEHLVLEPILPGQEEQSIEVKTGFDPGAIRLTGNVTGQPPFKGTLKHHGWRVKEYKLAAPPEGQDELVVFPAEVDLP
jgi:hypothetical protein